MNRPNILQVRMATRRQVDYLMILFDDHGYSTKARKGRLQRDYGRDFLDELTQLQAHQLIEELKPAKYDHRDDREEDDRK